MAGRKRVYAVPMTRSTRPYKKSKRTFKRRGKRTSTFTSRSTSGSGINYGRRMNYGKFRRLLWNNTQTKVKFRSTQVVATSITTPVSVTTKTVTILQGLFSTAANPFWSSGGGAVSPNGFLPQQFTGPLVLRGGVMGIRLTNSLDTASSSANGVMIEIMLIQTNLGFDPLAISSTQLAAWDTSFVSDFNAVMGKILLKKKFLLKDGETSSMERKLRCRRVDLQDHIDGKNQLYWLVTAGNVDDAEAHAIPIQLYFNVSFCADAT